MSYKPQDVFLGVIDLFVIILPGALLVFGGLRVAFSYPEQKLPWEWGGLASGTAFVIAAYLLGHLTSMLGSGVEDWWWDDHRDSEKDNSVLRKVERAMKARHRRTARNEENPDQRRSVERSLKACFGLTPENEDSRVRRWAFKAVRLKDPVAAVAIDRKDADRRFFRNAMVVMGLLALLFVARAIRLEGGAPWMEAAGLVVLWLGCWRRYADQDRKFTREVFEYFLLVYPQGAGRMAEREGDT